MPAIVVASRLIVTSVLDILSNTVAPQNQPLDLILEMHALICGVTVVSVILAVLRGVAENLVTFQLFCSTKSDCLLVFHINYFPRLVELSMYWI